MDSFFFVPALLSFTFFIADLKVAAVGVFGSHGLRFLHRCDNKKFSLSSEFGKKTVWSLETSCSRFKLKLSHKHKLEASVSVKEPPAFTQKMCVNLTS